MVSNAHLEKPIHSQPTISFSHFNFVIPIFFVFMLSICMKHIWSQMLTLKTQSTHTHCHFLSLSLPSYICFLQLLQYLESSLLSFSLISSFSLSPLLDKEPKVSSFALPFLIY
ncbi:hypothetical protein ACOSQ4_011680 [Xanthoceras sorbifolium]